MARQFSIITDSGSDLPQSWFEEHGVDCVPLGFTMDDVTYEGESGQHMDVKEFYARLRGGSMPKTFQITPAQAKKHIEPLVREGDVLIVSFSSGLSGTYGSYLSAVKELQEDYPDRKMIVVDSLCASLGQGLFVYYVVKKADSGATIEETAAYAEEIRPHLCHFFTVENLFHLKRGGRVSAATAVMGTMLNIKPVLHVDDEGHLIPIGKKIGRKNSIKALVEKMAELSVIGEDDPIFISHGDCMEDVEYLVSLVKEKFSGHEIFIHEIGSVIGTHSGAGTLALFFLGRNR